jgi:alpha-mannosidase
VQNIESSDVSLLVFGNGDGGGGPLSKMLENVRNMSSPLLSAGSEDRNSSVAFAL